MKTAYLFPGQGAQSPGMGADLYESFSVYQKAFDACSEGAGMDLKPACFEGKGMEGSDVIQPAIFAHSMATLAILKSEGVPCDMTAGLSLGEYSALTAAGVFDMAQCAALVRQRGRIMDEAFPPGKGGMLSVIGFDVEKVQEMIGDYDNVYVANHLSGLQIVLAGLLDDLKPLAAVFEEAGAKMVTLLDVRGPSHAPLLQSASATFKALLDETPVGEMNSAVYANVLGKPYEKGSDVRQLLADQMCKRVRWHDCTEHMIAEGVECFLEIGPGNVLGKLVKRRVGRKGAHVMSVGNAASLDKFLEQFAANK